MFPWPRNGREAEDLNFAFVSEMEGKWGDEREVRRYLVDRARWPFGSEGSGY
jgi:hypothetical protein